MTITVGDQKDTVCYGDEHDMDYSNTEGKDKILDSIANTDAYFKSQQFDEPDLTFVEKREIAERLLNENPALFLSRYGKYLKLDQLAYFEASSSDYEIAYYLSDLKKKLNEDQAIIIRNRRYNALQKLISAGEYFSDKCMKERNPLLYERMIGRYLTESEKVDENIETPMSWSSFLLKQIEKNQMRDIVSHEELDIFNMEDSSSSEDKSSELEDSDEKEIMHKEFLNIMYENFLNGQDTDFDYSIIDNDILSSPDKNFDQDKEDNYFDSEEPALISDFY